MNSCRLCLSDGNNVRPIYPTLSGDEWSEQNISELIYECTSIQVSENDGPTGICRICFSEISAFIKFRRKCQQVNEYLKNTYGNHIHSLPRAAEEFNDKYSRIAFVNLGSEAEICHLDLDKELKATKSNLNSIYTSDSSSETEKEEHINVEPEEKVNPEYENKFVRYKLKNKSSKKPDDFQFPKLSKRDLNIPKAYYGLCDICGLPFKHLWRHLQSHSDDFYDTCNVCGKTFKSKAGLQLHVLMHKDADLPCDICGKKYRTNMRLRRHMRVHTNHRPFSCAICDKKFYTKYNLDVHNRTHTGAKPFSCQHCKDKFTHSYALKHHMEKLHPPS